MSEEQAWAFLRAWLLTRSKNAKLYIEFVDNFQGDNRFKVSAFDPTPGYWQTSEHTTLAGPIVEVASKLKAQK